jgi:parvulin-like peptidyl-prolyl isomerase
VSQILLEDVADAEGGTDLGAIRASHIVYAPKGDLENAPGLPLDDPTWLEARTAAQAAIDSLRAIADPAAREARFAQLARTESDESLTAAQGGDLGWVSPAQLSPEMADALFASAHQPGEIIGPVSTVFGASVLLYVDRRPALAERVASIQQRLAEPAADFAAIARTESDGDQAAQGGDLGWIAPFEADPAVEEALRTATTGQVIGPLALDDGVHFYRVEARESRSLTPLQGESLVETAFDDWYRSKRDMAFDRGVITVADDAP